MVPVDGLHRIIMADIPGLIEGAHLGKGLGMRFLKHIERTRLILMLIETSEPDYGKVYLELVDELESFSAELAALPRMVVRSKSDLPKPPGRRKKFQFDHAASAGSGEGLTELVDMVAGKLGIEKVTYL